MLFPTAAQVLAVARSQVGTTENPPGSNQTPYGKAYGWDGVAWCGIFQWWCFWKAGIDLKGAGVQNPQFTPYFWAEAQKAGWVVEADENIQPGDVLFFDFEAPFNTAGIQHVEIARAAPSGSYVQTIGGNTSSGSIGSQDNGGGVFARTRPLAVIVGAVRPPYGQETDMPLTAADAQLVAAAVANMHVGATDVTWAVAFQRIYNRSTTAAADLAAAIVPALTPSLVAAIKALPAGTATVDDATVARIATATAQATVNELNTRLVR